MPSPMWDPSSAAGLLNQPSPKLEKEETSIKVNARDKVRGDVSPVGIEQRLGPMRRDETQGLESFRHVVAATRVDLAG